MSDYSKSVTLIMTTYNNCDFTESCCRVFRKYYPGVRIIIADGGSEDRTIKDCLNFADDIVVIVDGKIEDCRNAAAVMVDTPYLLTMDNDVKVIGEEALPLLVEVLENDPQVAQTGAYCVVVADFEKKVEYCSRVFNGTIKCDWCPAYFTLNRTKAWREVYGMPKDKWYFGPPPFERSEEHKKYNNGGDGYIGKLYQEKGWSVATPRKEVPVLHWVGAAWWSTDMQTSQWWVNEHVHIPIKPLNDWVDDWRRRNENK